MGGREPEKEGRRPPERTKGEMAGTHSGQSHLPLQVDSYLPQRAQARAGWMLSKGGLMTSSCCFLCSIKACITALVCSAKGLLLLWQVL